jgi:hypothetical protein
MIFRNMFLRIHELRYFTLPDPNLILKLLREGIGPLQGKEEQHEK